MALTGRLMALTGRLMALTGPLMRDRTLNFRRTLALMQILAGCLR